MRQNAHELGQQMKVFLSFAHEDRDVADRIRLALVGAGHDVFFDRDSLRAGHAYNDPIREAIQGSDAMVFLISDASITPKRYPLTELKIARETWKHPKGRVVPVLLEKIPIAAIPAYLTAVTLLDSEGDLPAEVVEAVAALKQGLPRRVANTFLPVLAGLGATALALVGIPFLLVRADVIEADVLYLVPPALVIAFAVALVVLAISFRRRTR